MNAGTASLSLLYGAYIAYFDVIYLRPAALFVTSMLSELLPA